MDNRVSYGLISGVGSIFGAECEKRGMLIRVAGDNIMLSPPLIMTPDEVDEVRSYPLQYPVFLFGTKHKLTESCLNHGSALDREQIWWRPKGHRGKN